MNHTSVEQNNNRFPVFGWRLFLSRGWTDSGSNDCRRRERASLATRNWPPGTLSCVTLACRCMLQESASRVSRCKRPSLESQIMKRFVLPLEVFLNINKEHSRLLSPEKGHSMSFCFVKREILLQRNSFNYHNKIDFAEKSWCKTLSLFLSTRSWSWPNFCKALAHYFKAPVLLK